MTDERARFMSLADRLMDLVRDGEVLRISYSGEDSDFVRFNAGRVRQSGHLLQGEVTLDLSEGARHATSHHQVCGDPGHDAPVLSEAVRRLRALRPHLPEDPYLLHASEVRDSDEQAAVSGWSATDAVGDILQSGAGLDLVGLFAGGGLYRGFASSSGQRNWFSSRTFNFDWSVFQGGDKAVKADYAGLEWSGDALDARMQAVREQLAPMARAPLDLKPGRYRAYLAPAAMNEILDMLAWGGFGLKSHRTAQTPLIRMVRDGAALSPRVNLWEEASDGVGPGFTSAGFIRPARVDLIREGRYADCLVGPRSAKEFGARVTGSESPQSLSMSGGALASEGVLEALVTGLLINNLWYCNYSDRNACRITGMTRFACFWVRDGRIQAPVNVMRFDDTVYSMLGARLEELTSEPELMLSSDTYGERSTHSSRLPGALIDGMRFTL
ncbi:MAG: metallopeptidase TldD-related protein [Gammaproteobacteria bacterium]